MWLASVSPEIRVTLKAVRVKQRQAVNSFSEIHVWLGGVGKLHHHNSLLLCCF